MFIMYDENMNRIEFPQGVTPLDIFISSIEKERVTGQIEGSNRTVNYGSTYTDRDIKLKILMESTDTKDYRLLRDEVYNMFQVSDVIYVSETYQQGKRYRVSIDGKYIPERVPDSQTWADATIQCKNVELPFAESIGTTQDIQRDGINSEKGLWGFGMGLLSDDDSHKYTHTLPRFSRMEFNIYNAGDVPIHPFEQELKIKISDVVGSTKFLELKNKTNGTTFRINEKITSGQTVVLDGPNITINSLQAFRKTNRKYTEIGEGINEFEILGATGAKIEFDFRYYYL